MADLPQITESVLLPVDIPVHPYLPDHLFEGTAVLPAVEAMQVLAQSVQRFAPDVDITCMTQAGFDKFLPIPAAAARIAAFCSIAVLANGDITAVLQTKHSSAKTSITRSKAHVTLHFPRKRPTVADFPLDLASAPEGICMQIPPDRIYRDLVPFGSAYQNISDTLCISRDGTVAATYAPPNRTGADTPGLLGSPFPLDAAFHAACAWGQRYAQTVAFPVGFESRVIFKPTQPGATYFSRIRPVRTKPDLLVFDIRIYDQNGDLFEAVDKLRMRDVSAGRLKPPQWVIDEGNENALERIRSHCHAMAVIELKAVAPFAAKTLSAHELQRSQKMKAARKQNYLAARLACKRVWRTLSGNDTHTPAAAITTVCADLLHPCCPPIHGSAAPSCTVSHDDRFAIAAVSAGRTGVDVEKLSARVLKSRRLYLNAKEQALVQASQLGAIEAALRIWSIKEAAAKALDITLADAWHRVQVLDVGQFESRFQIDGGESCSGIHAGIDRHVFTLVCRL